MRVAQRLEAERGEVAPSAAPIGLAIQQLGTRERKHHERRRHPRERYVLDEIEQRIRGPVDILENDDQRTPRGEHLDQQAPSGEHLFAVAPLRLRRVAECDADERREAARILVGVARGGERITHVR